MPWEGTQEALCSVLEMQLVSVYKTRSAIFMECLQQSVWSKPEV